MQTVLELSPGEDGCSLLLHDQVVYRFMKADKFKQLFDTFHSVPKALQDMFVSTDFDSTFMQFHSKDISNLPLIHKKVNFPTYAHEWSAPMLKDAALFELDLLIELHKQGYFLKDLHPWNVLIEKGGFKHVDVPSLIQFQDLPLEIAGNVSEFSMHHALHHLFFTMLLPYFIYPLIGYSYGKRDWIRGRILHTTLNASTSTLQVRDLLPKRTFDVHSLVKCLQIYLQLRRLKKLLKGDLSENLKARLKSLRAFVATLPVSTGASAYVNYYDEKQENQTYADLTHMNEKQRHIAEVLNQDDIHTVVDVACNTGWFAKLAAHLGKEVVAFDIDEACIEQLYQEVVQHKLNIVPMVASFLELTPARYSIQNGKKVLIEANVRLKSDCVMALGILHHLVLGLGLELETIIQRLSDLSRKYIILEYIDLEDDKIKNHSDFFPAYHKIPHAFQTYHFDNIMVYLKSQFDKVFVLPSTPHTRTLIICRTLAHG